MSTPEAPRPTSAAVLERLIQRVRRDPGYRVGSGISGMDVAAEVSQRGLSLLLAQWRLRGVPGGRMRFCERAVKVQHRRHLTIGSGSVLEYGARLRCLSRRGFLLGRRVTIGKYAILECTGVLHRLGEGITIGDYSSVGDYSFIGAAGGVTIGSHVLMGQRVAIHAQNHTFDDPGTLISQQGTTQRGVEIGDDCWLGSGSVILDGVTLGHGCVVSAGSVVTRSFPPNSVIAGVPARVLRERGEGTTDRQQ